LGYVQLYCWFLHTLHAATTGPSGTIEPSAAAGRGLRVCMHVPLSGGRAVERLRPAARRARCHCRPPAARTRIAWAATGSSYARARPGRDRSWEPAWRPAGAEDGRTCQLEQVASTLALGLELNCTHESRYHACCPVPISIRVRASTQAAHMQCNANGSNKQRLLRASQEDANYASSAVLPSPPTAAVIVVRTDY